MSQHETTGTATLERPTNTSSAAIDASVRTFTQSAPRPQIQTGMFGRVLAGMRRSPWLLALLAPVGIGPLAIGLSSVPFELSMLLSCVPILASATFLLTGVLACVFFLDDEES